MPYEVYDLQREIINLNQGQDRLQRILSAESNFKLDEFIIVDDVAYKIGMHPDAAPERKVAAEIIQYALTKNLGQAYTSVAIRGDNRCSQRSLISLALIAARRLMYQNKIEEAHRLLSTLGRFSDELITRIEEPQFSAFRADFTQENYLRLKRLLADIAAAKVNITELVLQANSDFSRQYVPEADSFNLALSSLTAFIMDKKLEEQSTCIGVSKAFLSDEGNDYAVLTPGMRGSTSADRAAFLSAMHLKLNVPILRVNSVVDTMRARGIVSLDQAIKLDGVFDLMATENDDGDIEISAFNSNGHTNLILTAEDRAYIQQELRECRLQKSHQDITEIPLQATSRQSHKLSQEEQAQHVSGAQNRERMANAPMNHSFIWKCLGAIAAVAGMAVLVIGIIYTLPALTGLGLGLGLIGGFGLVAMNGFFSNHARETPKLPCVMDKANSAMCR